MTVATRATGWVSEYRRWLSESESLQNAQMVVNHFKGSDWSDKSLAALCGNMRHESSINPDMYEYGYDWTADRGYGLVQWTPRSKYWDWATSKGLDQRAGDSQLSRIDYEVEQNIQWIARSDYGNMTFKQFRTNSGNWDVDYLTEAFTWSYERPNAQAGQDSMPARQAFARKCLAELDFSGTGGGGGGDVPPPFQVGYTPTTSQYKYEKAGSWKGMTYIEVKKGDTLSEIAKKHHVPVNAIKRVEYKDIANKNKIRVGDVLILPKVGIVKAKTYKVKKGDTLSGIAKRLNVPMKTLIQKNRIANPDMIQVGKVLKY